MEDIELKVTDKTMQCAEKIKSSWLEKEMPRNGADGMKMYERMKCLVIDKKS